jgi:hypothetical protein
MAYLSTPCTDVSAGKQCIKKAIDALFSPQASDGSEGHLETASESTEDVKPTVIWSCVYVQEITQVHFYLLSICTVFVLVSVLETHWIFRYICVFIFKAFGVLSYTIREHPVLYCHAPCLMNTWTTETYWDQQKRYYIL